MLSQKHLCSFPPLYPTHKESFDLSMARIRGQHDPLLRLANHAVIQQVTDIYKHQLWCFLDLYCTNNFPNNFT